LPTLFPFFPAREARTRFPTFRIKYFEKPKNLLINVSEKKTAAFFVAFFMEFQPIATNSSLDPVREYKLHFKGNGKLESPQKGERP